MEKETPDRKAIRAELETTRQAFHQRLKALPGAAWDQPSLNRAWTNGQLMSHLAQILEFYATAVDRARRGQATVPPLPVWLLNRLNEFNTRWQARQDDPKAVAERYDRAHAQLLARLERVQPHEWTMRTRSPLSPGGFLTVEAALRSPATHLRDHLAQLKVEDV